MAKAIVRKPTSKPHYIFPKQSEIPEAPGPVEAYKAIRLEGAEVYLLLNKLHGLCSFRGTVKALMADVQRVYEETTYWIREYAVSAEIPHEGVTLTLGQYERLRGIWCSLEGVVGVLKGCTSSEFYLAYHALRPLQDELSALFADLPIVKRKIVGRIKDRIIEALGDRGRECRAPEVWGPFCCT